MLPSNNCKSSRAAHQPLDSGARMAKPRRSKAVTSTKQPWQEQGSSVTLREAQI